MVKYTLNALNVISFLQLPSLYSLIHLLKYKKGGNHKPHWDNIINKQLE